MNLTILPGAALDDAKAIEEIINVIDTSMKELDTIIKRNIPDKVETTWSKALDESWKKFYDGSLKEAMEGMRYSAQNLKIAVDAALEYSNE